MNRSPFPPLAVYFAGLAIVGALAFAFANRSVPAFWLGVALVASYSTAGAALWIIRRAVSTAELAEAVEEPVAPPGVLPKAA